MTFRKTLAALLLLVLACGKRGDPRPPVPVIPKATTDLLVTQRADQVILSWSYPALTTAGKSLTDIRRITVFRYVEALPVATAIDPKPSIPASIDSSTPQPILLFSKIPQLPQAQFIKLSERIDSIEKANLANATAGAKLVYTDKPPFRSSDGRPVRVTYAVVTEGATARGEISNLAILVPLPVATPPAGLTATAKPEGITLTWQEPKTSVSGEEAPIISGYRIYRSAPGETLNEFAAPINAPAARAATYTDTPPYGEYEYRVTAIASEDPLLQSNASEPARVVYRDLIAPPAPATVTPLVELNAIRIIWEPVEATDLAGYRVYRMEGVGHTDIRDTGAAGTIQLVPQPMTETTYLNKPVTLGIAFRYAITSVDKTGNESAKTWSDWIVAPKTP
ncbi:MAG TPA: hypothetical protein VGQ76_05805 [Thermoanaerobaculia bacterium]|jgi:hypothetical protein|nr:hypothetical protein [Thermoanaerobaculia bacterium]